MTAQQRLPLQQNQQQQLIKTRNVCSWIAERRIVVRTLPVDDVPCVAGRFLHSKLVIFKVISFRQNRPCEASGDTINENSGFWFFKCSFCPPLAACDIYGRQRSKILLSAIEWSLLLFESDESQLLKNSKDNKQRSDKKAKSRTPF